MIKQLQNPLKKNQFEHAAWERNEQVCGIDEVGRGCFAGPVVAAAVVLTCKKTPSFLKDSKLITASAREEAFAWIQDNCVSGIGIVHHRYIDQHNIVNATKYAMKRAFLHVQQQEPNIAALVIDAVRISTDDISFSKPIYAFPFGESLSSSIAAASIVAKVTRDHLMETMSASLPLYQFESHKGYGTQGHRNCIKEHGMSIIHRRSYVHF
jgi:ribonuclease HII